MSNRHGMVFHQKYRKDHIESMKIHTIAYVHHIHSRKKKTIVHTIAIAIKLNVR